MPPDSLPRYTGVAHRKGGAPAPRDSAPRRADQLVRALAADILDGRRPVGSDLPPETAIAATQNTSTAAVRTALRHLETLGLIARSRGGAARIIAGDIRASYAVAARIDGTAGDYLARTRLLIERQRRITGDLEVASLLGTPEDATWLRLSGLRFTTDATFGPLSCVEAWLATRATTLDPPDEITPAALEALLGVTIVEVEEEIGAGTLTPAQARQLRARGGGASLSVLRRYRKRGGVLVAAVRDIHPADRAGVLVRLRRA